MNSHRLLQLSVALTLIFSTNAWAEGGHAKKTRKHREHSEHERIANGVKNGSLTKEEAKDLHKEQQEIHKEAQEYKSDGKLTKDERKDLHEDLKAASKDIYEEKHDSESRTRDPGVNARQENQEDRIKQGIKSGELTKHEAHTLAEKEAHLRKLERRLKEDGLTTEERARLQENLNKLSVDIYKQKHDSQEQK